MVTCYCNQVFNFYIVFFNVRSSSILQQSSNAQRMSVIFKSNSYFFCSCSHENIYASWSVSMRIYNKRAIASCLQPYVLCTDHASRCAVSPQCVLIFQVLCLDWVSLLVHVRILHCEAHNSKGKKA